MNYPFLFVSAVFLGFGIFYMRNSESKATNVEVLKLELGTMYHNQWLGFGFICLSVVMLIASAHFV